MHAAGFLNTPTHMKPHILSIDFADPSISTDVVHLVEMSDGRTLSIWSGASSAAHYDQHTGDLRVGAELTGVTPGDDFDTYHFA